MLPKTHSRVALGLDHDYGTPKKKFQTEAVDVGPPKAFRGSALSFRGASAEWPAVSHRGR